MSWFSFIALAITLHQFLLLFFSVGSIIPIRYLAGTFMCVQMLLGAVIAYNGADAFQRSEYQMKIPEDQYFLYAIPAVCFFILGLHLTAGKLKGEILDKKEIARFIDNSGYLPYIFIIVGFLASYFPGGSIGGLAFIVYLISGLKFIGLFMLLLGTKRLKLWLMALVFGSIIVSTLRGAMFHDFLTWLIMLGAVLGIKFKPTLTFKTIGAITFILIAVIIQQVKGDYRTVAYTGEGGGAGLQSFQRIVEEKESKGSLFSPASLAKSNIRINQGYIITNIMITVPDKVPFQDGKELMQILEAAFLPRIIAPDKLNAGDRTIFTKYSGLALRQGTSMGLSSLGDSYINFGIFGGCIMMFFWGLAFSVVLNGFFNFSRYYPVLLLFTPLVFYYPIRPDCELQTSLGHLVKSCVLIYLLILFWKKDINKIQLTKPKQMPAPVPA